MIFINHRHQPHTQRSVSHEKDMKLNVIHFETTQSLSGTRTHQPVMNTTKFRGNGQILRLGSKLRSPVQTLVPTQPQCSVVSRPQC